MLYVVAPVYNEEASVTIVAREWITFLRQVVGTDFRLLLVDDGSKDSTPRVLHSLAEEFPEVRVVTKANSGHGQSCVFGYEFALKEGADWIFQIDSDGQCDPKYFAEFWRRRHEHGVWFGFRVQRDDGKRRWLISRVVSFVAFLASGVWVRDANVPYRLMRADCLAAILPSIPTSVYLANILVSLRLQKQFGIKWVNIGFRDRIGGSPSVKSYSFLKNGLRLYQELRAASPA